MSVQTAPSRATLLDPKDKQRLEDVGFMTCMTLTLLGNYAQTGHFGGPLAYTPYNVAVHLAGPKLGGLRHDYRRPKHPYGDKFMLAAGHCAPTCYALWMIMGEALYRKFKATGDKKYYVAPKDGFLAIDALGFRRGAGALKTLLQENGLADDPLFAEAKEGGRGIHALSGHIESIDQSNDVNGGPSGVGLATAAGKAAFWDMVGAPVNQPKVIAFEGEFALCAGHAQELKNQALALKVGKRLRVMFSENNAGIDDSLIGGVIDSKYTGYDFVAAVDVVRLERDDDGQRPRLRPDRRLRSRRWTTSIRPIAGRSSSSARRSRGIGRPRRTARSPDRAIRSSAIRAIPYAMKMNSDYFVTLAKTFEDKYGVEFQGIRNGAVTDTKERLVQFKTNMDVAMSVLEKNGLGDWLADRIVENGDQVKDDLKLSIDVKADPFLDERLRVANLPGDTQTIKVKNPASGAEKEIKIALFRKAGEVAGARRAISEVIKWCNYVTGGRVATIAADLSESVNMEHGSLFGHYDPEKNPAGTRLKAAIQEAGNASTAIGIVGQSASLDPEKFAGMWAWSGTYGAFTPLMYLPARVWSQQNQDSKFRTGVLHILAGHSGPETAADARTHFGIFAPQVWKLFPRGHGHQRQLLGLQRRGGRLLRRRRDRRTREEGRASSPSKSRGRTFRLPIAASSPIPTCGPPRRGST